jgi:hypothetical protein
MTSPICCAACASPAYRSLVASAFATASLMIVLVWSSWRLISAIEVNSSSVELATFATLAEASSDSCSAALACCVVWSDESNRAAAVDFIVEALLLTTASTSSTRSRNDEMARSIADRRFSFISISSRCFSI